MKRTYLIFVLLSTLIFANCVTEPLIDEDNSISILDFRGLEPEPISEDCCGNIELRKMSEFDVFAPGGACCNTRLIISNNNLYKCQELITIYVDGELLFEWTDPSIEYPITESVCEDNGGSMVEVFVDGELCRSFTFNDFDNCLDPIDYPCTGIENILEQHVQNSNNNLIHVTSILDLYNQYMDDGNPCQEFLLGDLFFSEDTECDLSNSQTITLNLGTSLQLFGPIVWTDSANINIYSLAVSLLVEELNNNQYCSSGDVYVINNTFYSVTNGLGCNYPVICDFMVDFDIICCE